MSLTPKLVEICKLRFLGMSREEYLQIILQISIEKSYFHIFGESDIVSGRPARKWRPVFPECQIFFSDLNKRNIVKT